MSYVDEIKKKIGNRYDKLVNFAKEGHMTVDDFKQFAKELKETGKPTIVLGKHLGRIENQGITWDRGVEMRNILEDWWVQELYGLTTEEARQKIYNISRKVDNMNSLFPKEKETLKDSNKDEPDSEPNNKTVNNETGAPNVTVKGNFKGNLIFGDNVGTVVGRDDNSTTSTFNISSLDLHLQRLLKHGQKEFLEKHLKEESLTTLDGLPGTGKSLLKFDTILRSVCMIEPPGGGWATGFLTKISDSRYPGIAFMTAGHVFQEKSTKRLPKVIDFASFKLHFGHMQGTPGGKDAIKSCQLKDNENWFMRMFQLNNFGDFRGSVGLGGERRFFPGNTSEGSLGNEDYCLLLFTDPFIEEKLLRFGLKYLPCGSGNYLEKRWGIVSIFGHPGVKEDFPNGPLRVSYGREKVVPTTTGQHLCYDIDTLPGNSGSPIIGRGANDPEVQGYLGSSYSVKAIHVKGGVGTNYGQGLVNMEQWIKPAVSSVIT